MVIYIEEYGTDDNELPVGTDIIRQIIENKNNCIIDDVEAGNSSGVKVHDKDAASTENLGSNVTIRFNCNDKNQKILYDENNKVIKKDANPYISLGHELIHSLRSMKGHRKKDGTMGTYFIKGKKKKYVERQEELDTVGIDHIRDNGTYADANNWYFTENSLRREHGLYERAAYAV